MPNIAIGSNNPFRNNFVPSDDNTSPRSHPPSSHPFQKSPSTTTTIIEEDENENNSHQRQTSLNGSTARCSLSPSLAPPPSPPPIGPLPAVPVSEPQYPSAALIVDGNKIKSPSGPNGTGDGHILITIQSTDSASTPPGTGTLHMHRLSMDPASRESCNMWPALRFTQQARIRSKRTWIIIKVAIAVVIVVGAVAVGLGISKAVSDAKQN